MKHLYYLYFIGIFGLLSANLYATPPNAKRTIAANSASTAAPLNPILQKFEDFSNFTLFICPLGADLVGKLLFQITNGDESKLQEKITPNKELIRGEVNDQGLCGQIPLPNASTAIEGLLKKLLK